MIKYLNNTSRFRKNFIKLASSSLIVKIISLCAIPFITRLYTPENFGYFAQFSAALNIISAFSTWRFDWSVPNASNKEKAINLIGSSLFSLLITMLLVTLFIAIFASRLSLIFSIDISQSSLMAGLFIILVAVNGIVVSLKSWFVWDREFSIIGKKNILESVFYHSLSILFGLLGFLHYGLILSKAISVSSSAIFLILNLGFRRIGTPLNHASFRSNFNEYRMEATSSTVVSLINTFSLSAPIILLSSVYSSGEVGWYALVKGLIASPISIFSSSIGQSFWAESANLARNGEISLLNRLYLSVTKKLALLSLADG